MGSIKTEADYYNENREKYKVEPFDVEVSWYTGDVTTETVVADDGEYYYFDFSKNQSHYAHHSWCKRLTEI